MKRRESSTKICTELFNETDSFYVKDGLLSSSEDSICVLFVYKFVVVALALNQLLPEFFVV